MKPIRILFSFTSCILLHQHISLAADHSFKHKASDQTHAPAYAWKDPRIKISSRPSLMGKQMGRVETPGIQPLGYTLDGKVKVFQLVAQPIEQLITDGDSPSHKDLLPAMRHQFGAHHMNIRQKLRAWGYNGSTPGPTLDITEGDTVRIIFKNELPEPTTIHWHGIELPFAQDGSSDAKPVQPGETHIYEFTVHQSGTYLYHSGFNISKQELYGLAGLLIIHPKKYEKKVDRHIAILLQEWALLPGNVYPNVVSSISDFNWFTFNGRAAPNIPIISLKQGERVKIHMGNISMDSHPIHVHGHRWTVVGTEGGPIQTSAQWKGSTVNVAPGETRELEFVAWNPGSWPFHCHKMHHVMSAHAQVPMGIMAHGGMFTFVNVQANDPTRPWRHPSQQKPDNHDADAYGYTKKQNWRRTKVNQAKARQTKPQPAKTQQAKDQPMKVPHA